jgi:hypothetical protein
MDEALPVIPNIGGSQERTNNNIMRNSHTPVLSRQQSAFNIPDGKPIDPDVKKMMESSSSDFNVTKLPHKKTKEEEESESAKTVAGTSSWVIVVMAVVVVLLICAIVYLVLKYNETCIPPPNSLLDNLQKKRGEVIKHPPQMNQHNFRPDQNRRPQQPQAQQPANPTKPPATKQELINMLKKTKALKEREARRPFNKLPSIPEHPEPETDEPETKEAEVKPETVEVSQKPTEEDNVMINDFYKQMEQNAEDDEESVDIKIEMIEE